MHFCRTLVFLAFLAFLTSPQSLLAENPGYASDYSYNQALLGAPTSFRALNLAFPKTFQALSDSIRTALQAQSDSGSADIFRYEIGPVLVDSLGNAIAVNRVADLAPDAAWSFLRSYAPVSSDGKKLEFQAHRLHSDPLELVEYRFVRSGYIVRQLFVQSAQDVYQINFLVRGAWSPRVIETYESVVSSIYLSTVDSTP
jgi:hypothetical protein